MYLIQDRHGKTWITAAGILRLFKFKIHERGKRYFYDYDWIMKVLL